ncbi:dTDP-4-dehydrorhamnose reductase family protein [Priestia aryabhattai]|uniref:dTDP-4-dehydrorhamnose reductase family protein n=1 Tax=Priestia aryabhattai TaxID=412384 RepID=UPI003C8CD40E
MKILVLGGQGMAGHVIKSYFQSKPDYTVYYTSRNQKDKNSIYLEIKDFIALEGIIDSIKPNIIINCIGILNESASSNSIQAFQINSLLPHQLTKLAERYKGKVVHISTDCVFSGTKGDYKEGDPPDGTSIYAQSKQLGEIIDDRHLTVRTSIIGPELKENGIGLFLWFMQQKGTIKGYKNVLWNGVTTLELAKALDSLINNDITGLYHLGSEKKISKFDLLNLIKKIFNKDDVEIIPDTNITLDRTIKNTRKDFKYNIPSYEQMLLELKDWMDI